MVCERTSFNRIIKEFGDKAINHGMNVQEVQVYIHSLQKLYNKQYDTWHDDDNLLKLAKDAKERQLATNSQKR